MADNYVTMPYVATGDLWTAADHNSKIRGNQEALHDLATRLYAANSASATISAGTITVDASVSSVLTISPESGSDDTLTTINGGSTGDIVLLTAASGTTIRLGATGNIVVPIDDLERIQPDTYTPLMCVGTSWHVVRYPAPLYLGAMGPDVPAGGGRIYWRALTSVGYIGTDVATVGTDVSAWRIFTGAGSLLFQVREDGALLAGSTHVITRGTNANGYYVRMYDGTQICTHRIGVVDTGSAWTYPAAFVVAPRVIAQISLATSANVPDWYTLTPSATSVTILHESAGDTFSFDVIAIGRWK